MVGLAETLKNKLKAEYADPTKYAALKEEIARDWSTAADGTATLVAKAKAALRLCTLCAIISGSFPGPVGARKERRGS